MAYEQVKGFYPKDMGNKKGWCLQNVAKGFHAYPSANPSASAKVDMQINKNKGTFHSMSELPTNCAVPVYVDTPSIYEHVVVYDKGNWYEDGRRCNKPSNIFGWGEWCNGFQIVKKTSSTKSFLPAKGYWCLGDCDERIGVLDEFLYQTFPAYFPLQKKNLRGNLYGKTTTKWITEFQKRTKLYPDGCVGKITYAELKKYGFKY